MAFLILLLGIVLVVVAYQGTHPDLAKNLSRDLPQFFPWFLAIVAILSLGYLPGMKTPSRLLLALVAIVMIVKGWPTIQSQLAQFAQVAPADTGQGAVPPSPTSYVSTSGPSQTPGSAAQIASPAVGSDAGVVGAGGSPPVTAPNAGSGPSMLAQNIPSPFNQIISSPSIGFGGLS